MATKAKDNYNSYANRSAYLQRAFLTPAQKANTGMNNGATGVNTGKFDGGAGTKQLNTNPMGTGAGAATALDFKAIQKAIQEGIGYDPATGLSNLSPKLNKNGSVPTSGTTTSGTTTGTTTTGAPAGLAFSGDYAAEAQKLLTQLQQLNSTPFKYDPTTDPSYAAAKQSLEQGAALAKDQTYADMADRGILNSSVTTGQLGSIEQQSVQSLAQIVPGLEANAYNRYTQGINNQSNLIQTMLGQLNYQQGFEADQRWNEADVTGTYESPEIQKLMQTVVNAKQGWAGTTDPAARLGFQKDADSARAALAQLTGRSTKEIDAMFGSKVGLNSAQGNFGMGGIETMAAKAARQESERYTAENKYRAGRDTVSDAHWEEDNKRAWAQVNKPSGGGGSGAPSFSEVLKGNTNALVNEMLSNKNVNSVASAEAWIKANMNELKLAGVTPNELKSAATKYFTPSGGQGGGGLSSVDIHEMTMEELKDDPEYLDATTQEERDKVYQKHFDKISGLNAPKPVAGGVGDPFNALYSVFSKIKSWTGGGK